MNVQISRELFSAFTNCKYKAHLLQTQCPMIASEFAQLSKHLDAKYHTAAKKNSLSALAPSDRPPIPSSASDLRLGKPVLFDVPLEIDAYRSVVHALRKAPGTSTVGPFHYEPILFCRTALFGKSHRLLLAFDGLVLGTLQGRMPDCGVLIHGPAFSKTRVRLGQQMPAVLRLIKQLRDQLAGNAMAMLVLNRHCNACEFGKRCMEEATANDSLSLLQGVTEMEIARCKRKGIFTLTQLSYTFRPRRRPQRAKEAPRPHSFALQALALREHKIYVNSEPHLATAGTRVFFDVEGVPDRESYYLIGVLIDSEAGRHTHSFWADDERQQETMLAQFVHLLSGYSDYVLYHFGNYDTGALKHLISRISMHLHPPLAEIQTGRSTCFR